MKFKILVGLFLALNSTLSLAGLFTGATVNATWKFYDGGVDQGLNLFDNSLSTDSNTPVSFLIDDDSAFLGENSSNFDIQAFLGGPELGMVVDFYDFSSNGGTFVDAPNGGGFGVLIGGTAQNSAWLDLYQNYSHEMIFEFVGIPSAPDLATAVLTEVAQIDNSGFPVDNLSFAATGSSFTVGFGPISGIDDGNNDAFILFIDVDAASVPAPTGLALMLTGLVLTRRRFLKVQRAPYLH